MLFRVAFLVVEKVVISQLTAFLLAQKIEEMLLHNKKMTLDNNYRNTQYTND